MTIRPRRATSRQGDDKPTGEVIHFNPWRDFNDAPLQEDPFGIEPDAEQLGVFLDVVFGYCEGLIPVRGFVDKGQGSDGKPNNIWIEADASAFDKLKTFATWAWREGAALYVIPGTVAEQGQARAHEVLQMQAVVVDLDAGDILAKLAHLVRHLGTPTLVVESGGRTPEGAIKLHVWWKLTEAADGRGSRHPVPPARRHRHEGGRRHPLPLGPPADPRGRLRLSQGRLPAPRADPRA